MERLRDLWTRYHVAIMVVVTGALAWSCYGFVVQLPFFRDDLPIMSWLSRHGWRDIWTRSSENQFYRPLAFTIYKLGRRLPSGPDRAVLHAVSLLTHWASAGLVAWLVKLRQRPDTEAFIASVLYVVFPFAFMAVPWITALSHPLVALLTLLAACAALKGRRDSAVPWWLVSLAATVLAPTAHESGYIAGVIVAGVVLVDHGLDNRRHAAWLGSGIALNLLALAWRASVPGAGEASLSGLQDWAGNTMFSLHGLVYPVGSLIGTLVHRFGVQDFLLVAGAAVGLSVVLVALALRQSDWRWAASSLWWWAAGMLPAAASLSYGYNYTAPRVYSLAAPGIVMLWAGLIVSLSSLSEATWVRLGLAVSLSGAIVAQNVSFLVRQRHLFTVLNAVYRPLLEVAARDAGSNPGFVNVPTSLAYQERTYAMILETVLIVPPYSNVSEFLGVNGVPPADVAVFTPVQQDRGLVRALRGQGLTWDQMRQFAVEHDSVWLSRWSDGRLTLDDVGDMEPNAGETPEDALVTFEGGSRVASASATEATDGRWAVTIDWVASEAVDGRIFVHVRDADGELVAQIDGPALGGMVPPWSWRPGDRVRDVRYVSIRGSAPYTLQAGLFNQDGRYPAYHDSARCADDACPVVTFGP